MSKISLAPAVAGTGIFTIASPGTSTNRTLTLPDDTGTIVTNSGNQAGSFTTLAASSTATLNTLSSSGATLTGGTINGIAIGGSTAAAGSFTTLNTSGQVVFNDAGANVDFRVESDTFDHALFVEGSSGFVGIGTSSPKIEMQIESSGGLQAVAANEIALRYNVYFDGVSVKYIQATSKAASVVLDTNGSIRFINTNTASTSANSSVTGFTERMRIDSAGNVLVGTTSTSIDSSNFGIGLFSGGNISVSRNVDGGSATMQAFGNAGEFRVLGNGNVLNTNNSYGSLSDVKLKQDIVDAGSQWDDLKAIRIRKFRLKNDPDGILQIGVIAQELEEVSPGLVSEHPDYEVVEVPVLDDEGNPVLDDEGNPTTRREQQATGETTKSVKATVLYMKAVKALQEAMERIEALEASNTALEARIAALETGA